MPRHLVPSVPFDHLMTETEWRNLGVQQSTGWVHYLIHKPGALIKIHGAFQIIDKLQKFLLYTQYIKYMIQRFKHTIIILLFLVIVILARTLTQTRPYTYSLYKRPGSQYWIRIRVIST